MANHKTGAERRNDRMDKIWEGYQQHVARQKLENPAWYQHHTQHIISRRYEGCTHCEHRPAYLSNITMTPSANINEAIIELLSDPDSRKSREVVTVIALKLEKLQRALDGFCAEKISAKLLHDFLTDN